MSQVILFIFIILVTAGPQGPAFQNNILLCGALCPFFVHITPSGDLRYPSRGLNVTRIVDHNSPVGRHFNQCRHDSDTMRYQHDAMCFERVLFRCFARL